MRISPLVRRELGRRISRRIFQGATWAIVPCAISLTGCHDLTGSSPLPAGVEDPTHYNTPSGALQQAAGVVTVLRDAAPSYLAVTGLFTDELTIVVPTTINLIDARQSPGGDALVNVREVYGRLQSIRGHAMLARAALEKYAPDAPTVTVGEVLALEGYSEILLADLFCSGVPLSTVDFQQDFTYHASSSTMQVYAHAATLLDTAVTLAGDTGRVATLARVGLARALAARGLIDSAARVVASVPTGSTYELRVKLAGSGGLFRTSGVTVSDREGHTGQRYISGADARTGVGQAEFNGGVAIFTIAYPLRYDEAFTTDSASVVFASGVEARLIEAEAALKHGSASWLTTVNALRTDGSWSTAIRRDPVTDDSIGVDTTWGLGTGHVTGQTAGVRPLVDPGNATARIDSLFADRAFWLFMSGHRQGDLRRLARATSLGGYGTAQDDVYPTGPYRGSVAYGAAVFTAIPDDEDKNPLFHGCLASEN